ncbi:protein POF1B [Trichomycterus rosablanca]|uniref:protein POF1B n=1 Tax=Trichomycterus rosablanca TaxID=2290929 RepID=UPI002F35652A
MTLPTAHSTTTYRTLSVSSDPDSGTMIPAGQFEVAGGATLRAVNMGHVRYVNGPVDGSGLYGNVRVLMPMQRQAESYMVVNQGQQMFTPLYLQNPQNVQNVQSVHSVHNLQNLQNVQHVQNVQRLTVDESDAVFQHQQVISNGKISTEFSAPPSPIKSPEPLEVVDSSLQNVKIDVKTEVVDIEPLAKLDTRYFGELLAGLYQKNSDIHTCISEHVAKISGRKHLDSTSDYKEKEEIEQLIPKGMSELTKQQIRYLLQTRMTADKTMRLLLSTFSNLKEELVHLQNDLRRLEGEKDQLEKDLSFKADQAQQYDRLLNNLRDSNRQLQTSLKESTTTQRSLEAKVMSSSSADTGKEFRIKDLESSKRALEQENELLRKKLENQSSNSNLSAKTQELSRHYEQMLSELRDEKDRELKTMRSQLVTIQTEHTTTNSGDKSLQLKINELMSSLEQRDSSIRRLEEEIKRLQKEKYDLSKSVTNTVTTKTYSNQYPILGLLNDNYQYNPSSPVRQSSTMVVTRRSELSKQH